MLPVFSEPSPRSQARDRAAVVTTTILATVVDALREWVRGSVNVTDLRAQVEDVLRAEFDDLAHQVRGERFLID